MRALPGDSPGAKSRFLAVLSLPRIDLFGSQGSRYYSASTSNAAAKKLHGFAATLEQQSEHQHGLFCIYPRRGARSVLLGVSDAITELGNRQPGDDLGEHLATALRQSVALEASHAESQSATAVATAPAPRKRLGKSLEQIREAGQS